MVRLHLYNVESARSTPVTTDRYDSYSPEFSPDGKWLYFLSDRNFVSVVGSPWGSRQPEPFFDKQTKVYHVSMKPGERSPFQPDDELSVPAAGIPKAEEKPGEKTEKKDEATATPPAQGVKPAPSVPANLAGIETRLIEVPLAPGNYRD